ncbi:MAG TPA: hypothetical protein VLM89_03250 [Phycisphaerae bacterium]|nr:hypothetical protein [Phycisphaerae bacterium]
MTAIEVYTGFGRRGKRAERASEEAAQECLQYLGTDVPIGSHPAEQILPPPALSGAGEGVQPEVPTCFFCRSAIWV